jgi:exopolyphosphatase/guanosine-5'-triphosphate,3'-diphosphate pyrophosphatase
VSKILRAVIDVGTNSVKLLVAEVSGREVVPLWEESRQTRLGQGFYETRELQPGPIAATADAVRQFVAEARGRKTSSIRIIATSAARDALNAKELTDAVERESGLPMEIISGDQEADWVYQGVLTDISLANEPLLVMDVGGGSTEFIFGSPGSPRISRSFPLGSVRLLEASPHRDPPLPEERENCQETVRAFLRGEVTPWLSPSLAMAREKCGSNVTFAATGGTASLLARMEGKLETFDRAQIEATRLGREAMLWHLEHLWGLSLGERRKITGLPPNRADVILMGTMIFASVMEEFDLKELRISTRGLRFAALVEGARMAVASGGRGERA